MSADNTTAARTDTDRLGALLHQVNAAIAQLAGVVALLTPAVDGFEADVGAALALVERAEEDLLTGRQAVVCDEYSGAR